MLTPRLKFLFQVQDAPKIYMINFLFTADTYQKTSQCRLKRSLVPKGPTSLAGDQSWRTFCHMQFLRQRAPVCQKAQQAAAAFPLQLPATCCARWTPISKALQRLRANTSACCSAESQHREEDQIQLVAASAAEMTHKTTLNQLELLRSCRLHAQQYPVTIVRRKVMNR